MHLGLIQSPLNHRLKKLESSEKQGVPGYIVLDLKTE